MESNPIHHTTVAASFKQSGAITANNRANECSSFAEAHNIRVPGLRPYPERSPYDEVESSTDQACSMNSFALPEFPSGRPPIRAMDCDKAATGLEEPALGNASTAQRCAVASGEEVLSKLSARHGTAPSEGDETTSANASGKTEASNPRSVAQIAAMGLPADSNSRFSSANPNARPGDAEASSENATIVRVRTGANYQLQVTGDNAKLVTAAENPVDVRSSTPQGDVSASAVSPSVRPPDGPSFKGRTASSVPVEVQNTESNGGIAGSVDAKPSVAIGGAYTQDPHKGPYLTLSDLQSSPIPAEDDAAGTFASGPVEPEVNAVLRDVQRSGPAGASAMLPHEMTRRLVEAVSHSPNGSVELTLSPEELGRVRLSFTTQDGALTMLLQAERPDTLDLLRRHIDTLASDFKELGFDELNFRFAQNGDPREFAGANGLPDDEHSLDETIPPESPPTSADTHRIPSDRDGGLDLRM